MANKASNGPGHEPQERRHRLSTTLGVRSSSVRTKRRPSKSLTMYWPGMAAERCEALGDLTSERSAGSDLGTHHVVADGEAIVHGEASPGKYRSDP
jgi:hypothetical protein